MESKKNGVTVTLKTITPELARTYLTKNNRNRKLTPSWVEFYCSQMKSGQWQTTGDTIKLSTNDDLLDGQHRLHAVIMYGKPIDMFVAEGLPSESFDVLDTGKTRSAGDVLSVFGVEKANNIASIVRFILHFKKGVFSEGYHKVDAATHHDIAQFVKAHPNINEVLDFCHHIYRDFRYIPTSVLGGLYFLFAEKNQQKVDEFFEQYRTGIDLKKTDPVYVLRDKLIRDQVNKTKFTRRQKVALFIMCWNAFVLGKEMKRVEFTEKFPEII